MEETNKIYHERQSLQLCLLHSLNNLFQSKDAFTRSDLNSISQQLDIDNPNRGSWTPLSIVFKPHHNEITGNYDINVLIAALEQKGRTVVWHDCRNGASSIDLDDRLMGIVVNVPVRKFSGLWRSRHWVTLRCIQGVWYNLDSDFSLPYAFRDIQHVREFLDGLITAGAQGNKQQNGVTIVAMMLARQIWISVLAICTTILKAQNITQYVSSCSDIRDIHFPFRLKADPLDCGDPRFEFDCQKDRTAISFSKKYYVLEINYHEFLIRAVDPGLEHQTKNCTSLPDYFNTSVPSTSIFDTTSTPEYYYLKSTSGTEGTILLYRLDHGFELSWKRTSACRECEGHCFPECDGFSCKRCKERKLFSPHCGFTHNYSAITRGYDYLVIFPFLSLRFLGLVFLTALIVYKWRRRPYLCINQLKTSCKSRPTSSQLNTQL